MVSDKKKHSGEEQAEINRLRRENEALKKTIADLAVDNAILKEANEIFKKKQTTPACFPGSGRQRSNRSYDLLKISNHSGARHFQGVHLQKNKGAANVFLHEEG